MIFLLSSTLFTACTWSLAHWPDFKKLPPTELGASSSSPFSATTLADIPQAGAAELDAASGPSLRRLWLREGPLLVADAYTDEQLIHGLLSVADAVILVISSFLYYRRITSQRTIVFKRQVTPTSDYVCVEEGESGFARAVTPTSDCGSIEWGESEKSASHVGRQKGFSTPPFGCFDNLEYTLYAVCCTIPRMADTVHAVGLGHFWCVIFTWVWIHLCLSFMGVLGGAWYLILPAFLAVMRHRLRAAMGMADTSLTGSDVLMSLFCSFCEVAQEAREVDMASNSRVACFLRLITDEPQVLITDDTGMTPLVGAAVAVPPPQLPPAPAP
mmetsp:Transcript_762/g.1615  ORF Transcript_762/g.1615 Transcript_762/m.1615 type:complete len:328 (+) Transcript_762:75-1058(+)